MRPSRAGAPLTAVRGLQCFDPPIVLSVADFEQLLQQGGVTQQDDAGRALIGRSEFVACLRQQVRV